MSPRDHLGARPPNPLVEHKLRRDVHRVALVLVESGFDQRFWRMHLHGSCQLNHVGQGGRPAALQKLAEAAEHPEARVLAILDADLDRVDGRLMQRPDVVWTDGHDLETTLLGLPVLEKLARHAIGAQELAQREATWGETIRSRLFRHGVGMGRLRWLKQHAALDTLVFAKPGNRRSGGGPRRFTKYSQAVAADWAPSLAHVVQAVVAFSSAQPLLARDLVAEVHALPPAEPAQVCNGHDLVGFLRELIAPREPSDSVADRIAVACDREWLAQTGIWHGLQAWEREHPGFPLVDG